MYFGKLRFTGKRARNNIMTAQVVYLKGDEKVPFALLEKRQTRKMRNYGVEDTG